MRKRYWLMPFVLVLAVVMFSVTEDWLGQGSPPILPAADPINTADARESMTRLRIEWANVLRSAARLPLDQQEGFIAESIEARARLFAEAINTRLRKSAGDSKQLASQVLEELAAGIESEAAAIPPTAPRNKSGVGLMTQ